MSFSEVGIVVYLGVWFIALIDIVRSKFKRNLYELLWLFAIFVVPIGGVVGYFLLGWLHKIEKKPAEGHPHSS